jgi:hypothetical protein
MWQKHPILSHDTSQVMGRSIAKELKKNPDLAEPIEDVATIKNRQEIISGLMSSIFPQLGWDDEIAAAVRPGDLLGFYPSSKFRNLFMDNVGRLKSEPIGGWGKAKLEQSIKLASLVLHQRHNQLVAVPDPVMVVAVDGAGGQERRYFELALDFRFVKAVEVGQARIPGGLDVDALRKDPTSVASWLKAIVPSAYEIEGFVIIRGRDISDRYTRELRERESLERISAVHPAVAWRFSGNQGDRGDGQDSSGFDEAPIGFQNVYPFYGCSEIRGMGALHKDAIQADLQSHIAQTDKLLGEAFTLAPMPLLMEIQYRLASLAERASKQNFSAVDEHQILGFFENEVWPALTALKNSGKLVEKITDYEADGRPSSGSHGSERKRIRDSFASLANGISYYIKQQQEIAQECFPHYFTRRIDDAVEFNMFIGQEIHPARDFSNFHLKNLRLWQLQAMCGCVLSSEIVRGTLEVPLVTAHWIGAHAGPLDIRFDWSTRRFVPEDHENPYYQLIKDAEKCRGTQAWEKLVEPGKITIFFTDDVGRSEYVDFAHFLVHKGILKQGFEEGEVQGIPALNGTRYLKLKVSTESQPKKK